MELNTGRRSPVPLVLLGMISLQFSSAFVQDLFASIGPAGAALLRVLLSAALLCLIARPSARCSCPTTSPTSALTDVAVSAGSACNSASQQPSHVLTAMGLPPARIRSSVRLSFGRFTMEHEVVQAARSLTTAARHDPAGLTHEDVMRRGSGPAAVRPIA